MSDEKPKPFAEVVRRMRAAQRAYFKSRDRAALDESIRLEREVDAALDSAGEHQGGLFSAEPNAAAERRDAAAKALREAVRHCEDAGRLALRDRGFGEATAFTDLAELLSARADAVARGE